MERERAIGESGFFGPVTTRKFAWSTRYDTRQYLGLLGTYSDHLRLPDKQRGDLFGGVAEVIQNHGGYLEKPYVAVLYVASVKMEDGGRNVDEGRKMEDACSSTVYCPSSTVDRREWSEL